MLMEKALDRDIEILYFFIISLLTLLMLRWSEIFDYKIKFFQTEQLKSRR